ncbi:MAG: 50S ribosomal protein L6 [Acidimicrobiales bacterium]
MSRVGRMPITVPAGVEVTMVDDRIAVRGPKGALERVIPSRISVRAEDGGSTLVVERPDDERASRALHGLTRTLIANMVLGVTEGFSKDLEIVGIGYRATAKGPNQLELALGFSHPVVIDAPEGISFEVPMPTRVTVRGIDKERVGQVAADIRKIRKPEPYKGKGVRYAGETVQHKAGKAGK